MRSCITYILVVALLSLSLEGVASVPSMNIDGSHDSAHLHEVEIPENNAPDQPSPDCEETSDHCGHGHASTVPVNSARALPVNSDRIVRPSLAKLTSYSQAPPTPPPNA